MRNKRQFFGYLVDKALESLLFKRKGILIHSKRTNRVLTSVFFFLHGRWLKATTGLIQLGWPSWTKGNLPANDALYTRDQPFGRLMLDPCVSRHLAR